MHYKLLARCNQELKNITDALQNYEEALAHSKSEKNSSEKALIYLERGQLFSKQGDYEAAIADFEKAINMKGDKVPLADVSFSRLENFNNQASSRERQVLQVDKIVRGKYK
jgi:tetratricopeptide (TPR) repeat protein